MRRVCAVCHATDKMGAPAVGDKETWSKVMEKGMDKVLENAIKGTGGMPPKGGSSMSDEEIETGHRVYVLKSKIGFFLFSTNLGPQRWNYYLFCWDFKPII